MSDEYEPEYEEEEAPRRPRDGKIDEAKTVLMDRYLSSGTQVFYKRQLEIWLENDFFHWITARALTELGEERRVGFKIEALGTHQAHFYFPLRHRYPRRQIRQTLGLIAEFSDPVFTRAVGRYGEMLVESGFARTGFRIMQHKVNAVDGHRWTKTNHDLDFLIRRDGIRYGVEVKNQLGYIDQTEFQIKLQMCEFFGVRPMFVTRRMPKNYMNDVYRAGGYSIVTVNQNYPLLAEDLAKRVRDTLNLPVNVIQQFPDTALNRFEHWHEEHP